MPEALDLFEELYNTADVPLGSLVLDTAQPHEDSWKEVSLKQDKDFSVKVNKNISVRADGLSETWFHAQVLGWLLRARAAYRADHHFRVAARKGFVYHLSAPRQTLGAICADPKARLWLEEAAGVRSVHMVTELCTMVNPALERADGTGVRVEGTLPVTDGAATYATLGGGGARRSAEEKNLVAWGERIYKIKFRRVKLRFVADKVGGDAVVVPTLKRGCVWKPLLVARGDGGVAGREEQMMVEVDLEEEEEEVGGEEWDSDEYEEEDDDSEGSLLKDDDEVETVEEEQEEGGRGVHLTGEE